MLSRVKVSVSPNGIVGANKQEVRRDLWEKPNCVRAIGVAFSQSPGPINKWSHIPCNLTSIWQGNHGKKMTLVLADEDAGFYYYRRPIDIERQEKYNEDPEFRIDASEWWDNPEMNEWWKNNYPGIWWEIPKHHPSGETSLYVIEAVDSEAAKRDFFLHLERVGIPSILQLNQNPEPKQIPEQEEFLYL